MSSSGIDRQGTPGLDKVSSGTRVRLITYSLLLLVPMLLFAYFIISRTLSHHPKTLLGLLVCVFAIIFSMVSLALIGMFIVSASRSGGWRTDNQGITRVRLLCDEFIPWGDVISVTGQSCEMAGWSKLRLSTNHSTFLLDTYDPYLVASAVMHLRSQGTVVPIDLPVSVQSLLKPPELESIPEIYWSTRRSLAWWRTVACGSLTLSMGAVSFLGFTSLRDGHISSMVAFSAVGISTPVYFWYTWLATYTATAFSFSHIGYSATTIHGTVSHLWEDVTKAYWSGDWYGKMNIDRQPGIPSPSRIALALHTSNANVVYVPWDSADENSTLLIHAITQRLKLIPKPILLPTPHPGLE